MGLPNVEIIFKQAASTAIQRGDRGVVALILKDTASANGSFIMNGVKDIPDSLSNDNKAEIKRAFLGNVNQPNKVIAYVLGTDATDYTAAQNYFETVKWDYIAVPDIKNEEVTAFAAWIKGCRDNKDLKVKAVLPHCTADHEGIINFDTDNIVAGTQSYSAAQYCSRIAGLLAGTPLSMSATYSVLSEVDDVPHYTKDQIDTMIDAGKFVLVNDGEKVKVGRAVNSLVTVSEVKGADFKKIKIVDIMDLIHSDIKGTIEDSYIGKVPNDYDHKCILLTGISAYFEQLEDDMLLDRGMNNITIDMDAQKEYLKGQGINADSMKDQEIKEANTGSYVFLSGNVKILDAMEDIELNLSI
ncbi:MAG: phage tail sheath subtilisin-like domain-containing protein [Bacillota bacterium]|nr:phage tail sheath subtilisin-like domain-containing protein [Bacillota bacterium]